MKRGDAECVRDILECIERIKEYVKDADEDEFCESVRLQDLVYRRLEIIEESFSK